VAALKNDRQSQRSVRSQIIEVESLVDVRVLDDTQVEAALMVPFHLDGSLDYR
jgi:hypothetical protein